MIDKKKKKPRVYWVLQDNQTTPLIIEFLKNTKQRLKELVDIRFLIPSTCPDALKLTKEIEPLSFTVKSRYKAYSYEGYAIKKELLAGGSFSDGLSFAGTLLLDDLGGGNLHKMVSELPEEHAVNAMFLQIPTPLGSSDQEEKIFHAMVLWAKQAGVPVIGYELLPLDTRWTLAPSMLDGIITTRRESHDVLTGPRARLNKKVWLLPEFEGRLLSISATTFWSNGLNAAYHYGNTHGIPLDRTPLYIAHNVALTWEYKLLIRHLTAMGKKIHLMFSISKDQMRGTHTHEQIIRKVCHEELEEFASFSFHDLNAPWEMTLAEAVIACSSCYNSTISTTNSIPTIIYDTTVQPHTSGHKETVAEPAKLINRIETIIESRKKRTEIAHIMHQIINRKQDRE